MVISFFFFNQFSNSFFFLHFYELITFQEFKKVLIYFAKSKQLSNLLGFYNRYVIKTSNALDRLAGHDVIKINHKIHFNEALYEIERS